MKKSELRNIIKEEISRQTDINTLKQVIRKANSYDSDAVAAIEDGYYVLADNLPNLIEDLQKVVNVMKDDGDELIYRGRAFVEATENELKIYKEIQALLDMSALGKIF